MCLIREAIRQGISRREFLQSAGAIVATPLLAGFGVPITKDTDYWIELTDEKTHVGLNKNPYHIKALPDEPPKVEVLEPGQDIRADATDTIPVKISAVDDFGIWTKSSWFTTNYT